MNVRWSDVSKKTRRIIRELEEIATDIEQAILRRETTLDTTNAGRLPHGAKFAKLHRRIKDARMYLIDGAGD